jgi:hypothetical protein
MLSRASRNEIILMTSIARKWMKMLTQFDQKRTELDRARSVVNSQLLSLKVNARCSRGGHADLGHQELDALFTDFFQQRRTRK